MRKGKADRVQPMGGRFERGGRPQVQPDTLLATDHSRRGRRLNRITEGSGQSRAGALRSAATLCNCHGACYLDRSCVLRGQVIQSRSMMVQYATANVRHSGHVPRRYVWVLQADQNGHRVSIDDRDAPRRAAAQDTGSTQRAGCGRDGQLSARGCTSGSKQIVCVGCGDDGRCRRDGILYVARCTALRDEE